MKDLGKYLIIYVIGCIFMFGVIAGYTNAKGKQHKELHKEQIKITNKLEK